MQDPYQKLRKGNTHGSVKRKGHPWGGIGTFIGNLSMIRVNFAYTLGFFQSKKNETFLFHSDSGTNFCFLTGFRVESDSKNFKGDYILGPDYFSLTGFRVESD